MTKNIFSNTALYKFICGNVNIDDVPYQCVDAIRVLHTIVGIIAFTFIDVTAFLLLTLRIIDTHTRGSVSMVTNGAASAMETGGCVLTGGQVRAWMIRAL